MAFRRAEEEPESADSEAPERRCERPAFHRRPWPALSSAEEVGMGLLDGKKALVFGVANDHSIAWGIARAFHEQGATLGFSSVESLIERRVRPLAGSIGS